MVSATSVSMNSDECEEKFQVDLAPLERGMRILGCRGRNDHERMVVIKGARAQLDKQRRK